MNREMLLERARHALERDLLPMRQVPQVAESLSRLLQGANLSLYGADGAWTSTVGPLVDLLARKLAPPVPAASEPTS